MDNKKFTSEELHEIARKIVVDIKEKTGGNIDVTQLVVGMCNNIIRTENSLRVYNVLKQTEA